ncbi:MAG: ABC transporter ATP-binding protein [Candidatus Heimdallarchaeum aukensis]|uniref:ABC transporter ATP-binding protein n=1 Tax=Candidatus Heimdallarchaeum aukensis TaxID=2876573 RepID=A0A9Y1BK94_9ARCH|nr:MAG: ABC transporter ATP-binding protein [Candidatus Heimdallarchaeum aukensis]
MSVRAPEDILLEVKGLKTYFFTEEGVVKAIESINFVVYKSETLGLVGESGSGKSVTALSILGIVPDPPGKVLEGEVIFHGQDLRKLSPAEMRKIRGNQIAQVFQDPMTSLNPVFTVGDQIGEAIILHQQVSRKEAREKAIKIMSLVGIPSADERVDNYPFEFSGGMRQRVMIAMALSCNPELLIADEPTTALDVTIQAQILELLKATSEEFDMSIILITHDMGVIAEMCDRVAVMYAGYIAEVSDIMTIFKSPLHPYTKGLLGAIPRPDAKREDLTIIRGSIPNLINPPSGCRFHPRCDYWIKGLCEVKVPEFIEIEPGHELMCHLYTEEGKAYLEAHKDHPRISYAAK